MWQFTKQQCLVTKVFPDSACSEPLQENLANGNLVDENPADGNPLDADRPSARINFENKNLRLKRIRKANSPGWREQKRNSFREKELNIKQL